MIETNRYSEKFSSQWNDFVCQSKNATFLFNRSYMDYHSDRFEDYSLIFKKQNKIIALLPASLNNNIIYSHEGLTYGGIIVGKNMTTALMLQIFSNLLLYLKTIKANKIVYKSIPHIYHKIPSEEENYCLFRYNFSLLKREISSTINIRTTKIRAKKLNGYRKAVKLGLKIIETSDCNSIIKIINHKLNKKYKTNAVHSADELNTLKNKFKKEIKFFNLVIENKIEGGAILFLANNVVHAQYIGTSKKAKKNRALDFIICSIYEQFKNELEWFDYGISTEKNGRILNLNLIKSKEEFGLSGLCYDTYELNIK